MGSPSQIVSVGNISRSTLGTGTPTPDKFNTGFPVGDASLKNLFLHIRSKVSAAGGLATRGRLTFLRSLVFKTDKHGQIIEGVDGVMLQQMSWVLNPTGQGHRLSGDTQDADHFLKLPMTDILSARPEDTGIDLLRTSSPALELTWGAVTDIETTGGTTLSNLETDLDCEIDPGPVSDLPILMPSLSVVKMDINQTVAAFNISLPYGDRIYRALVISQRDSAAGFAELNNTEIGVNTTDKVSLKVNNYPWVDALLWSQLQNKNFQEYHNYSITRGVGIIDFMPRRTGGYLYGNALGVSTSAQGRVDLKLDVTSTSDQIWIGLICAKPIPTQAVRPVAKAA